MSGRGIRRAGVALVAVASLMLSACGQAPEPAPEPTSAVTSTLPSPSGTAGTPTHTPTVTSSPAPTATANQLTPLGSPDLEPKQSEGEGAQLGVTGVRLGAHDGFDRVVFDLSGSGVPGWNVDYTDSPVAQGSGHPIEFEGRTALVVYLHGLTGNDELAHVAGIGGVVGEVIPGFNHHGSVQVVIALDEQLPYSVQVLEGPGRVVVDITG